MGICTSDPRTATEEQTLQPPNQTKPEPVSQNAPQDNNQQIDDEEDKAKAALRIQQGFRGNKAKQEAEKKREELKQDQPKEWVEYKGEFKEPDVPTQFKEQLKKFAITKEDRVFPPQQANDGSIYKGQWSKGLQNGYGKLLRPDGTLIDGMWQQGEFVDGNIFFNQGDIYIGTSINGTRYFKDGAQYDGEVKLGIPEGKGTLQYQDGSKYIGNFINGMRHGEGSTHNHDGAQYEGQYFDGQQHGHGTFRWPDGTKYVGPWVKGVMQGKGIYTEKDGTIYEGDFVDGRREGKGILTFQDKSRYEGQFHQNKRHGKGKIITKEGMVKDCEYNNDQAVQAY